MIYSVTDEFIKIAESSGWIQNNSSCYSIELSDSAQKNNGVLIYPLNRMPFNGDAYIRCAEPNRNVEARVFPFSFGSTGGDSVISTELNIATEEDIDNMLSDVFD